MDESGLKSLLNDLAEGRRRPDEVFERLRSMPFADLGFARVDHHRALRQGMPESVYGPGKTPEQCAAVTLELLKEPSGPVIVTRASDEQVSVVEERVAAAGFEPGYVVALDHQRSIMTWRPDIARSAEIMLVTAGTADLPVAEECRQTLRALGYQPTLHADCGVAGLHRLLAIADGFNRCDAVVVFAGMEGALASVVGGLTKVPVIAVPTSTGYGSSFEGLTALLAMTASCAAGVTVVGIDNGYGAACAVRRLCQ